MLHKLVSLSTVLVFSSLFAGQQTAPPADTITAEEYQVYAAAVDWFHQIKKSRQPMVADHTSTFSCRAVCNGFQIGGCNGLRDDDETPAERLAIVRRDLPQLTAAMSGDFEKKNQQCSAVDAKLPTKTKYALFGQTPDRVPPEDWDSPDYFFFSRVSFNAEHTLARIHIGFISGTDAKASEGKYFMFAKEPKGWVKKGSSAMWKLQP